MREDRAISKPRGFKRAPLAAAIALAVSAPVAFAAAPTASQLPGNGVVTSGTSITKNAPTSGAETITLGGTNAVITWGGTGTPTINTKQPGGFNIGSKATLHFAASAGATKAAAVLNIDASGNPSQIMGTLNDTGSGKAVDIFVANGNGIIVGSGAKISSGGAVGLIGESGNALGDSAFAQGASAVYDGITFNGTAGGDVSVAKGASISAGTTVLVAGGSNVNVDLGALTTGAATLQAGENVGGGAFASTNKSAVLTVSGQLPTSGTPGTIATFDSAGNAVNNGTLDLAASAPTVNVGGTFTNAGALTLPGTGGLTVVNNGQLTTTAGGSFASLTNKGTYTSNGTVTVTGGDLVNGGSISGGGAISVTGGDLTNTGSIDAGSIGGSVTVTNGSINNSGTMKNVTAVNTMSDSGSAGYTAGADYSIRNSGSISGFTVGSSINANEGVNRTPTGTTTNTTTGSFTNTGILAFATGGPSSGYELDISANNNLSLGGQVEQFASGATAASAVSATNPLGVLNLVADNGTLTLSTPLAFTGASGVWGQQVKIMADLSGVTSATNSTPASSIEINGGAKPASGYAIRVAAGKTVSAGTVNVWGIKTTDNPNVILQGTLSGNAIQLGGASGSSDGPVSDVFTGPSGGLNAFSTGTAPVVNPTVTFNFTGIVKNAKYTNSANFRYNYLPITSNAPLTLTLDPIDYQTNGTTGVSSSGSHSAVNILVNNDVTVSSIAQPSSVPDGGGSAVTGVNTWPNTHVVLQSTGNIDLATTPAANGTSPASFYWPGLVYLGNIDTANGLPAPGTVNPLGEITTDGVLNNVLPGNTGTGGGIHFMTALPLQLGGNVVTNANSWVNFSTSVLTNHYASSNPTASDQFFGGAMGTGNVVNYGVLPSNDFHTQAPVSTK